MARTQTEPIGLGETGPETVAPAGCLTDMGQLPPELDDSFSLPGVEWVLGRYSQVVAGHPDDAQPHEVQDVKSLLRYRGETVVSRLVKKRLIPDSESYQLLRVQGLVVLQRVAEPEDVRFNWHQNFRPDDAGVRAASVEDYHRLLLEIYDPA